MPSIAVTGTNPIEGFTGEQLLSAQTAEGELYEVDMRLRPSGNKGPIATRISSFIDYHATSAWTWEKLALTRARSVAGNSGLRQRIDSAIFDALCAPRDATATAKDVAEMRQRIAEERGDADLWDIKNAQGGMVDLEFISQYLQIANAARAPECLDENTEAALRKLAAAELLTVEQADDLIEASRLMSGLSQVLRLCLVTPFDAESAPEGLKTLLQRAADGLDFAQVENTLRESQATVKSVFDQMFGSTT